jgi:uncharacterized protein (DUF1330 family)
LTTSCGTSIKPWLPPRFDRIRAAIQPPNSLTAESTHTMAAYILAEVEVTDPALFADYGRQVPAVVAQYAGRYLVRGGAATLLEGAPQPKRLVVLEFDDMAKLQAFYNSPEYAPLLALRGRSAKSRLISVEGV